MENSSKTVICLISQFWMKKVLSKLILVHKLSVNQPGGGTWHCFGGAYRQPYPRPPTRPPPPPHSRSESRGGEEGFCSSPPPHPHPPPPSGPAGLKASSLPSAASLPHLALCCPGRLQVGRFTEDVAGVPVRSHWSTECVYVCLFVCSY